MKYQRRLFCECGWSVYDNGFQNAFFTHHQPCPECGRERNLKPRNVRWVSNPSIVWWKPWTWGLPGSWEGK